MRNQSKSPTHTLWLLPNQNHDGEAIWTPVGAAWINKDSSINIVVNSNLDSDERVQLRARKPARLTMRQPAEHREN